MESISQVHRDKQPQTVHYTTRMPDIDTLMQEWPEAVERVLSNMQLPSASLDVDIKEYTDILCSKPAGVLQSAWLTLLEHSYFRHTYGKESHPSPSSAV